VGPRVHHAYAQRFALGAKIDGYRTWIRLSNPATGASVTLHDVGPDLFWLSDDGSVLHAIIGRSPGGSGYIGRFVENLDTGEVLFVAGKELGSFYDQVCVPLAPGGRRPARLTLHGLASGYVLPGDSRL
jgi:hypothetical protein